MKQAAKMERCIQANLVVSQIELLKLGNALLLDIYLGVAYSCVCLVLYRTRDLIKGRNMAAHDRQ